MKPEISITDIRSFLSIFLRDEINNPQLTSAGVLLPLFKKNNKIHILLTQRTEDVEHHKGQISFPGGARDKTDATIIDTALRETEEEIGIQRSLIDVLGVLSDFETSSGFCITPVVGFLHSIPPLLISPKEINKVFDIPLSYFLETVNERVEQHTRGDQKVNVYFYHYGDYEIWGATAAIVQRFLHALAMWIYHKKLL